MRSVYVSKRFCVSAPRAERGDGVVCTHHFCTFSCETATQTMIWDLFRVELSGALTNKKLPNVVREIGKESKLVGPPPLRSRGAQSAFHLLKSSLT